MAVSLRDISERTGVNICSVSQVLNDHPRAQSLRPETRAKILAVAKELGYRRNELAASVARRHGNVLGFVSGAMGGVEYTGRIQNGVLDAASERGYMVTVHHLTPHNAEEVVDKLMGWRVAGVVFHISRLDAIKCITDVLDRHSIIWGTANLSNPGGIGVTSDDAAGIESAVRYLHKYGHKKIVFLAKFLGLSEYQVRREAGFRAGMRKHYPAQDPIVLHLKEGNFLLDEDYMRELAKDFVRDGVDAVVCESDLLALMLGKGALSAGLSLPEAFSMIGFGDSIYSMAAYPCLTTIAQDFEKMGGGTVHFITDAIEGKNLSATRDVLLPVKITERKSVCDRGVVQPKKRSRK